MSLAREAGGGRDVTEDLGTGDGLALCGGAAGQRGGACSRPGRAGVAAAMAPARDQTAQPSRQSQVRLADASQ